MIKDEVIRMRLTQTVAASLVSLTTLGGMLPALAQQTYTFTPTQTISEAPPLPEGEGWRPVNPQPLPPTQTFPSQTAPVAPPQPNTFSQPTYPQFPQQQPVQPAPVFPDTQFNLQSTLLLRSGETIATTFRAPETLYITPGETLPYNLTLDTPIQDSRGNVVVPAGAVIQGQFQPVSGGTQFVTRSLSVNGQSLPLFAQSDILPYAKDPRQTSGGAIAEDAAIGAAAGALLGGIFGSRVISTEKVLGGALAGAVIGNVTAPESASINPGTPLNLTVTQDFQPVLQ